MIALTMDSEVYFVQVVEQNRMRTRRVLDCVHKPKIINAQTRSSDFGRRYHIISRVSSLDCGYCTYLTFQEE